MIFKKPDQLKNGMYYSDAELNQENACIVKKNWDELWEVSERDLKIKFECN
jgi:hypothetical protein